MAGLWYVNVHTAANPGARYAVSLRSSRAGRCVFTRRDVSVAAGPALPTLRRMDRRVLFRLSRSRFAPACSRERSLLPGDRPRFAGQFEDVHPGIGPIDDVDVAAIVGLDIVGLDRDLAASSPFTLMQRLSVAAVIDGMK